MMIDSGKTRFEGLGPPPLEPVHASSTSEQQMAFPRRDNGGIEKEVKAPWKWKTKRRRRTADPGRAADDEKRELATLRSSGER